MPDPGSGQQAINFNRAAALAQVARLRMTLRERDVLIGCCKLVWPEHLDEPEKSWHGSKARIAYSSGCSRNTALGPLESLAAEGFILMDDSSRGTEIMINWPALFADQDERTGTPDEGAAQLERSKILERYNLLQNNAALAALASQIAENTQVARQVLAALQTFGALQNFGALQPLQSLSFEEEREKYISLSSSSTSSSKTLEASGAPRLPSIELGILKSREKLTALLSAATGRGIIQPGEESQLVSFLVWAEAFHSAGKIQTSYGGFVFAALHESTGRWRHHAGPGQRDRAARLIEALAEREAKTPEGATT